MMLFKGSLLDEHSHFLPVLEIKYLIQGHFHRWEDLKESHHFFLSFFPPILTSQLTHQPSVLLLFHLSLAWATITPCCSSHWGFVLVFRRLHESCIQWIFWSMTLRIPAAAALAAAAATCSEQRWLTVLLPVLMEEKFGTSLVIELLEIFSDQGGVGSLATRNYFGFVLWNPYSLNVSVTYRHLHWLDVFDASCRWNRQTHSKRCTVSVLVTSPNKALISRASPCC